MRYAAPERVPLNKRVPGMAAAIALLLTGAAVAWMPGQAWAATGAPSVTARSVITTTLPTGGNARVQNLNIYGAFSGLRPGEGTAGYDAWITCDDFRTFDVTLNLNTVTPYPDGSAGGTVIGSIPAAEQGHSCRFQATAPKGRQLVFDTSGWRPSFGAWELVLQGYVVTVAPSGGLY